jgi:hypothetical protein
LYEVEPVLAGVVFFVVADVRAGVVDVVVVIVAGLLRDGAQSPTENAARPLPGTGSQRYAAARVEWQRGHVSRRHARTIAHGGIVVTPSHNEPDPPGRAVLSARRLRREMSGPLARALREDWRFTR